LPDLLASQGKDNKLEVSWNNINSFCDCNRMQ
jgi:hypothetical protein